MYFLKNKKKRRCDFGNAMVEIDLKNVEVYNLINFQSSYFCTNSGDL